MNPLWLLQHEQDLSKVTEDKTPVSRGKVATKEEYRHFLKIYTFVFLRDYVTINQNDPVIVA